MQCGFVAGNQIVFHPEISVSQCSSSVGYVVVADQSDIALQDFTAVQVGTAFSWGFGSIVGFWFFGYVIGVAKKLISLT